MAEWSENNVFEPMTRLILRRNLRNLYCLVFMFVFRVLPYVIACDDLAVPIS